ncbi:MAG: Hvo_1808 family surface protein [Halolamina sp.]
MRRALTTVAVLLLVFGSLAPAAAAAPAPAPEQGGDKQAVNLATTNASAANDAPPDPEEDQLGWENGYWHNESIDVDQSDGLSEAELNATVSRAMARVEYVRELEFQKTVPVELISREEFANSNNRTVNETFRAFDDTKFEALLLVGEQDDSLDVQQENRGTSVQGYYSPTKDAIVIIAENTSSPEMDEFTLGHELVHALQDQHFNLSSINRKTRDGANADSGIVEGDANYVQNRYEDRCGEGGSWNGSCVRPMSEGGGGGGGLANIGVYFVKFQPYSDGPKFIASRYKAGGWAAVNAVYNDTPASAEQVIHPEKYGEDAPTTVELEDQHSDQWQRLRPADRPDYGVVGQTGVASMFVYPLYHEGEGGRIVQPRNWLNYTDDGSISSFDPLNYGFDYAEGWDGDRMHFYRNADNETAYVWRIVWDTPQDAAEFRDGYEQLLAYWGAEEAGENTYRIPEGASQFADAFHITVEGDTVTIVNAPTTDELSQVRSSVDGDSETTTATATAVDETAESTTTGTATETETTTTEGPGFSALVAVVSLLLGMLAMRVR